MSKDESSVMKRFRNFFGIKQGGSLNASSFKSQSKEITFTPELLKEIGPDSPHNNRIRTIREMCIIVENRRLEMQAVETLWLTVKDLLRPSIPMEDRHTALRFLRCLIKGQYDHLELMREHFFNVVRQHNITQDLPEMLEVFKTLTDDGKDLLNFEEETGKFLLEWMPQITSCGKVTDFLDVLMNVFKRNAAYLDTVVVAGLVNNICTLCKPVWPENEGDIQSCLKTLETIVSYSCLPACSLHDVVSALCRIVNVEKFTHATWKLMRMLLGTHLGHSAVYTILTILQNNQNQSDPALLRGGVFFIGMALWGSKRVPSLKHTTASVLPAFKEALLCNTSALSNEEMLIIHRLVTKYGKDQQAVVWDKILDIIECIVLQLENSSVAETELSNNLHSVLSCIERLYEDGHYNGSLPRFFSIIEKCASRRPESSVLVLVSYRAQSIHPSEENWLAYLYQLMEKYFRHETRGNIRLKVLGFLSSVLVANKQLYEDELIELVVLPQLTHIDHDNDVMVRTTAVQIIVDLAQSCASQKCLDLLDILERVMNKSAVLSADSPVIGSKDDSYLRDVRTAATGMIEIFKVKLFHQTFTHAQKAYNLLIDHLRNHYKLLSMLPVATSIRHAIFECLLQFRANKLKQLGLPVTMNSEGGEKKLQFSPYFICDHPESDPPAGTDSDCASPTITSSTSPVCSLQIKPAAIAFSEAFCIIIDCLHHERDWNILSLVLDQLPVQLQNKTLYLSALDSSMAENNMERLCVRLCSMVSDRNLGVLECLCNTPTNFTRSDFHKYILPVLGSMASYHQQLDRQKQRELVRCLEFGLISKCPQTCVNALRVCCLEMQDVMMRLLPSVLLKLSQISATIAMALPILEFLSNLIRIPNLYTNFVEDQYRSVFAIALPYTNPFKFSHYTVSLAHYVIAVWFLKVRLPFRKEFVGFIIKGLKTNVLRQFEESSSRKPLSVNEDSADRRRSGSLSSTFRKKSAPRPTSLHTDIPPAVTVKDGIDPSLSLFHTELTETCIDTLSRYTFSQCSSMPQRSHVMEFLLKGGSSQTWLLGNKLITITTSGASGKVIKDGLCEKCMVFLDKMYNHKDPDEALSVASPTDKPEGVRRRHRSAAVGHSVALHVPSPSSQDDLQLYTKHSTQDEPTMPAADLDSFVLQPSPSAESDLLGNLKEAEKRGWDPEQCNCWCQGWAEVYIRRPTGNVSWSMRIQNELMHDFPLADICSLFMASQEKAYDADSLGQIDSESLGENEYDSLHEKHFSQSDSSSHDDSYKKKHLSSDSQTFSPASLDMNIHEDVYATPLSLSGMMLEGETVEKDADISPDQEDHKCESTRLQIPTKIPLKRSASSPELNFVKDLSLETTDLLSQTKPSMETLKESDSYQSTVNEIMQSSEAEKSKPEVGLKTEKLQLTASLSVDQSKIALAKNRELQAERKPRGHTISVVRAAMERSDCSMKPQMMSLKEPLRGGVNPSFVFLQLYYSCRFGNADDLPILLPQSDVVNRALKNFDRIPPYQTSKIGVLYVGKGQAGNEAAILSNIYGSTRYAAFLHGLGNLIRLQDCNLENIYVGGLDLHGEDGDLAHSWQDDVMQVIFHVATLMPNKSYDPNCNAKKLHIGNDYVSIVYNDSEEDYMLGTIKGQFNYVNIVINPLDHESNAVKVVAKQDIANIIGHLDTKVISDANLAVLVRQMALHANLAAHVLVTQKANPKDPYASNWLERLRQIKRIRNKVLQTNSHENKEHLAGDFTEFV